MKILALEFSSERRSAAVVEVDASGQIATLGAAFEMGGHRAIGLVESALANAKSEREEIEVLAVGLGPGSYTGIRGAIALAQGWELGRTVRLRGISSVECIAAQAQSAGMSGEVSVIVDAQRNEFYLATYELGPQTRRELNPLRLASFAEIEAAAKSSRVVGPDAAKWFPSAQSIYPDATTLGTLAAARTDFTPGGSLVPIYLRETAFKKAPPPRAI